MKTAPWLPLICLLSACASTNGPSAILSSQQLSAYDRLFNGCVQQRLFEIVDGYIEKQVALVQIGNFRYESFICECTATAAAKRPYVAAMLMRVNEGEELNDDGERILKAETVASLLQCTATWLDKSAAVMTDQLDDDHSARAREQ